jgi:hypothetical protein
VVHIAGCDGGDWLGWVGGFGVVSAGWVGGVCRVGWWR